jgi:hypothetical protein
LIFIRASVALSAYGFSQFTKESYMRAITMALLGIIGLATVSISATAVPLTPERASAGLAREMVPVPMDVRMAGIGYRLATRFTASGVPLLVPETEHVVAARPEPQPLRSGL